MTMIVPETTPFGSVRSHCTGNKCQESPSQPKSAIKRQQEGSVKLTRRSVTFEHNVDVREVPHRKDLRKEDILATWYNSEDFERIKKTLVVTLRLMLAKKQVGSDQCTRGLEFRTPQGAKLRKKNKLDALTAVWNEQVAQWKENITDEDAISRVYQEQSLKCRQAARKFGLQDELAAQKHIGEDGDSSSVSSFSDMESGANNGAATNGNIKEIVVKQSCLPQAA